ncbi:hypothetical protein [Haloferax profundi]|uniref:hypothetical protein n=1 Tax=Haloferax profundi TaxID=1544718 RepID=UPI000A960B2A|nr:hypothetical protein [Haloferax profundi]
MPSAADDWSRSLALAVLVLLSGCAGVSAVHVDDSTLLDSSSASVSSATHPAENPWGHAPIVVSVDAPDDGRDYASLVESAVSYWAENSTNTSYDPRFVVRPNASDPDVRVSIVDEIDSCGEYAGQNAVGCAPLLDESKTQGGQNATPVQVAAGYDDETTTTVLTHEFGHLLGVTHDDAEVHPVMSPRIETTRLPATDATVRESPYRTEMLRVYVDLSNVSATDRDAYEAEIDHALTYYDSGAAGFTPDDLSITRVSDPSRAHVVVSVTDFDDGHSGARWRRTGESVDDDRAYEWYTGGDIVVDAGMGPTLVDWYVGSSFGYLLAADERAELPPPFRDSDLRDDPQWRGVVNESALGPSQTAP